MPGASRFSCRIVILHSHLSNYGKLIENNLRLTQGNQNLRATCPKGKLEFKFFQALTWMAVCYNDNECGIVVVHLKSKELSRPFYFKVLMPRPCKLS